jgi:hypothetical protein
MEKALKKARQGQQGNSSGVGTSPDDITKCMDTWDKAETLYKKKQWGNARTLYERIAMQYPGSDYAPQSLFMTDMCLYQADPMTNGKPNRDLSKRRAKVLELLLLRHPNFSYRNGVIGPDIVRTKLAIVYAELGDYAQAKKTLKGVNSRKVPRRVYNNAVQVVNGSK